MINGHIDITYQVSNRYNLLTHFEVTEQIEVDTIASYIQLVPIRKEYSLKFKPVLIETTKTTVGLEQHGEIVTSDLDITVPESILYAIQITD